jgi:glycosyltransferase involved in cell wall biosynthesis
MQTISQTTDIASDARVRRPAGNAAEIALLTGGQDRPYALGLTAALTGRGIRVDFIGSDELDVPELHENSDVKFLNLRGSMEANASFLSKLARVSLYYSRLLRYVATAKPRVLHILWNDRFEYLDRTLLMVYYKLFGKKIVFTAHNVNGRKRDNNDTALNRLTLKFQYRLCDHIFVHTEKMKAELLDEFGVAAQAVSVIPFGINETVPNTALTPAQAKKQLGIGEGERAVLFFGRIGRYKGLEFLADAFHSLAEKNSLYRLMVIGKPKGGCEQYVDDALRSLRSNGLRERLIERITFVPDEDTELYFKAADLLVLPYTDIFQSGLIFLAYHFGLPVVATDVGSFREEIVDGITGHICKPRDARSLEEAIDRYFASDLFESLNNRRERIREYGRARHSWDVVGETTQNVYEAV